MILIQRSLHYGAQVSGMAPQQVLDRMQSMAPMRPTETMAQQALGGQTGGTYLAPALYRPVVQVLTAMTVPLCCLIARLPHRARVVLMGQLWDT